MSYYGWPYYKQEDAIVHGLHARNKRDPIPNGVTLIFRSAVVVAANVLIILGLESDLDTETVFAFLLFEGLLVVALDILRNIFRVGADLFGKGDPNESPHGMLLAEFIFVGLLAFMICVWQGSGNTLADEARDGFGYMLREAQRIPLPLMLVALYHGQYLLAQLRKQVRRRKIGLRANGGGWITLSIITAFSILLVEEGEASVSTVVYVLLGIKLLGQGLVTWAMPLNALLNGPLRDADEPKSESPD